jgi:hypothetical protein
MEEQSMRVIGLDPGKITSWSDGEDTGSFPADDGKVVAHFAEHLDIDVAYIEGAYVHEKKTNYSHIIQHCIRIGRLIQAFESLDIRVVVVPAMTWKSQVLVIGGERVINNTAAQKKAAIKAAKLLGVTTKDHNIADAVCIQYYGQCAEKRRALT